MSFDLDAGPSEAVGVIEAGLARVGGDEAALEVTDLNEPRFAALYDALWCIDCPPAGPDPSVELVRAGVVASAAVGVEGVRPALIDKTFIEVTVAVVIKEVARLLCGDRALAKPSIGTLARQRASAGADPLGGVLASLADVQRLVDEAIAIVI